jgi:hypothetical protein
MLSKLREMLEFNPPNIEPVQSWERERITCITENRKLKTDNRKP